MNPSKASAVILAAGCSRRMGFFKTVAMMNGASPLERTLRSVMAAGISDIIVVTGHRQEEVEKVVWAFQARPVYNSRYLEGMFTSVQAGVASLSSSSRAFLLLPVDIPLVRPATILFLLRYASFDGITYPLFNGKRGHPPIIGTSYIPHILTYSGEGGLKRFLEMREKNAFNVAVADEGVLLDMDTPEDFETLCRRSGKLHIPTEKERQALFGIAQTPEEVIVHSKKVAQVALKLADSLNNCFPLDVALLKSAALLHDMCKTMPNHDLAAEALLLACGFPKVAKIVTGHMDLYPQAHLEASLLFLSDKLVCGIDVVPLAERKRLMKKKYSSDLETWARIRKRYARARRISRYIERKTGYSLGRLLRENI